MKKTYYPQDTFKPVPLEEQEPGKAEIVANLMKKENIGMVSDIDNYELAQLAGLMSINARAITKEQPKGNPVINKIGKSILELRVSHERKGRTEIVEITKNEKPESEQKKRRWWPF